MYQESEIVDLLMAAFLTPVIFVALRNVRLEGKRWFAFGYVAMLVAYVFTVAEGFVPTHPFDFGALLNTLEHWGYALSGVGFAGGAWSLLVYLRGRTP